MGRLGYMVLDRVLLHKERMKSLEEGFNPLTEAKTDDQLSQSTRKRKKADH